MRILLIEDDKDFADSIKHLLSEYFIVDVEYKGQEGLYSAEINSYDLIIIDYLLPDISGLEVCKQLRENKIHTPILFLTAKSFIKDKVEVLGSGADDYMTKPFSSKELLARIHAVLRRGSNLFFPPKIRFDNLVVDTINRCVSRGNIPIKLSRKEYDLLEYMLRNPNRTLTRELILEHIWESGIDQSSNVVDVYINFLRQKVDKPFGTSLIKTVYGLGYKISDI